MGLPAVKSRLTEHGWHRFQKYSPLPFTSHHPQHATTYDYKAHTLAHLTTCIMHNYASRISPQPTRKNLALRKSHLQITSLIPYLYTTTQCSVKSSLYRHSI